VEEKRAEVLPVETVSLSGYDLPLTFSQGKPHRVDKDAGLEAKIHSFKKGKAHLLYQPVPVGAGVAAGFEDVAVEHGYEILIGSTNHDPERMKRCIRRMVERKAEGVAVLVISQDLDELFEICDRLVVIHGGRLSAPHETRATTREAIGLLMAGMGENEHAG